MKYLPKALLIYSAVLATILFVIGLVTSRSNEALVFQLLFAPVVLYLIYKAVKIKSSETKANPTLLTIAMVIFILLFGISFTNLISTTDTETIKNPKSITTFNVSDTNEVEEDSLPQYIFIELANEDSFVNVRTSPDTNSEVIGQAIQGERFLLIEELDDWYKVDTKDQEGYINKDFAVKN